MPKGTTEAVTACQMAIYLVTQEQQGNTKIDVLHATHEINMEASTLNGTSYSSIYKEAESVNIDAGTAQSGALIKDIQTLIDSCERIPAGYVQAVTAKTPPPSFG